MTERDSKASWLPVPTQAESRHKDNGGNGEQDDGEGQQCQLTASPQTGCKQAQQQRGTLSSVNDNWLSVLTQAVGRHNNEGETEVWEPAGRMTSLQADDRAKP